MTRFTSIVSMNHQGAVGIHNRLPWKLKTDLAFFRAATLFNIIITNRGTYEGLGTQFLQQRTNIILSDTGESSAKLSYGQTVESVEDAVATALAMNSSKDCFVVGGAKIHEIFKPFVDRYYITLVDHQVAEPGLFFDTTIFDDAHWQIAQHAHVDGDGLENEKSFSIFELVSRRPEEIIRRHEQIIAKSGRAIKRSRRGGFFPHRRGVG